MSALCVQYKSRIVVFIQKVAYSCNKKLCCKSLDRFFTDSSVMSSEKPVLEEGMMGLKDKVLEKQIEFLCEELGDPGRYFPQLKSKGILNVSDCELIRSRVTCREKIQELVGLVKGRRSNKGEHSFDILVDALKKQRVQAHIARGLQKALAKAKEDFSGI